MTAERQEKNFNPDKVSQVGLLISMNLLFP